LCGNWQDFNRHDASCGPSAIAELLVLQAGCPSCHPTNSIKVLPAYLIGKHLLQNIINAIQGKITSEKKHRDLSAQYASDLSELMYITKAEHH